MPGSPPQWKPGCRVSYPSDSKSLGAQVPPTMGTQVPGSCNPRPWEHRYLGSPLTVGVQTPGSQAPVTLGTWVLTTT